MWLLIKLAAESRIIRGRRMSEEGEMHVSFSFSPKPLKKIRSLTLSKGLGEGDKRGGS